ncbi:MAG: hypothetical protein MPL62_04295 [Alphaproteobacteria bacterium]|nr:hypothetical protein [Alphaproteobacteria bacterium]
MRARTSETPVRNESPGESLRPTAVCVANLECKCKFALPPRLDVRRSENTDTPRPRTRITPFNCILNGARGEIGAVSEALRESTAANSRKPRKSCYYIGKLPNSA